MDIFKKVFVVPIKNEYNHEKADRLLKFVSDEKRKIISACFDEMAKKESLYSHIAVKIIIKREFGINIDEIAIVTDEMGKPHIAGHPEIHFNISHTDNLIAIALSHTEVGVDVQTELCPKIKIAKRFFTAQECDYIYSDDENTAKRFTEIWTKKEAYIKCSGIGLRTPLNEFCVLGDGFKNMFKTFEIGNCLISFYDGQPDNDISLVEMTENEIENI